MLSIIAAVLVFGVIILIHELGHFLLAKKNGIGVVEFSIGMGPRLFQFTKGETLYSIKLLPFGGSCMMLGEDENEVDDKAFNNKSVWERISVIAAGPLFNFILAFIFALVLIVFNGYDSPQIAGVTAGSPAQQAGLREGDVITKVNNQKVVVKRDVLLYMMINPGKSMEVHYDRPEEKTGEMVSYSSEITPKYSESDGRHLLGIMFSGYNEPAGSLGNIIKYSAYEVKYQITTAVKSLGMLISGKVGADDLTGPVGIVVLIDDSVKAGMTIGIGAALLNLASMCVLLSANLGIMNLLPIPALDGGRLVFLIIEAIRGKAIDKEKEGMVHMIGMMALMALMVFVLFNDVRRFF